jgi:hypothetical protein
MKQDRGIWYEHNGIVDWNQTRVMAASWHVLYMRNERATFINTSLRDKDMPH